MRHIQIHPSIWVFPKAFTESSIIPSAIDDLIDLNSNLNWSWAQTNKQNLEDNLQDSYRTNKIFSISSQQNFEEIKDLDDLIFNKTTKLISEYATYYGLNNLVDEGYAVLKYEKGMEYRQHHDCGGRNRDRVVSMLVYINDDYEGGELEFPHLNITYRPVAGDVVLFPSNYTFSHVAHPVLEGTKYCIVTWMAYGND